jgi:hypothetical protein
MLPGDDGSSARIRRSASVSSEGLRCTVAPYVSIITLRYGFWSNEASAHQTSQSRPNWAQAKASAAPHWPAPVSVALGINIPDRFQILWRLGDPDKVLEMTRPHWESWNIAEAREMVKKFFVPEYAAAVEKCPCEGNCFETLIDTVEPVQTSAVMA